MEPNDLPVFVPQPGGAADPADNPLVKVRSADLDAAEVKRELAAGDVAGATIEALQEAEHLREMGMTQVGGPQLAAVDKLTRKIDRSLKAIGDEHLDGLTQAEVRRDDAFREMGANPIYYTGWLADAIAANQLPDYLDRHYTVPVFDKALQDTINPQVYAADQPADVVNSAAMAVADTIAIVPPTVPPPPPPISDTTVPPIVPPVVPPVVPPPPPGACPPPSEPGNIVVQLPATPGPGWAYVTTYANGCVEYRPISPPPPPPPPKPGPGPSPPPPFVCEPPATTQVACIQVGPVWESLWWYCIRCLPGCGFEVCSFLGPSAPVCDADQVLRGPYQRELTRVELDAILKAISCDQGTSPPGVPPPPTPSPVPFPPPPPPVPGVPPVVPPPQPAPVPGPVVKPPPDENGNLSTVCAEIQKWIASTLGTVKPGEGTSEVNDLFARMAKRVEKSGPLAAVIGSAISGIVTAATETFAPLFEGAGVENPKIQELCSGVMSFYGWLGRITGADMTIYSEPWDQVRRYAYSVNLPDQSAVDQQYLANLIDKPAWVCATKTNGNNPDAHYGTVQAVRVRPGAPAVIDLWRRNIIDVSERDRRLRELGVISAEDRERLIQSMNVIPTPGELISMMVRDVADPVAVRDGGLDKEFTDKFQGQIEQWAYANGMSRDHMLKLWEAHWQYPSDTQVYEMIRRLRPGKNVTIPLRGQGGQIVETPVSPVDLDTARDLLGINDKAPGWRDRLLAVSYLPPNLTTIRTAHRAGTMSREEVLSRVQDLGYTAADSETITRFIEVETSRSLQSSLGAWTPSRINKEYVNGAITRADAQVLLSRSVLDPAVVQSLLDDADKIRTAQATEKCIKGVRRRYFTGAINAVEAVTALIEAGVDKPVATSMGRGWECERMSRSREPMVARVIQWYKLGVIDAVVTRARLTNLGYESPDIDKYLEAADTELTQARIKAESAALAKARAEAEKAARAAAAAAGKARKEKERLDREAFKEEQARLKALTDLEKAREKANKADCKKNPPPPKQ